MKCMGFNVSLSLFQFLSLQESVLSPGAMKKATDATFTICRDTSFLPLEVTKKYMI